MLRAILRPCMAIRDGEDLPSGMWWQICGGLINFVYPGVWKPISPPMTLPLIGPLQERS